VISRSLDQFNEMANWMAITLEPLQKYSKSDGMEVTDV
jgi:hypothetical protein